MATTADNAKLAAAATFARPARSLWKDAWYAFSRDTLAIVGLVTLIVIAVAVVLGPTAWPQPINKIDFAKSLEGPSFTHPFGTDDLGRDIFARALWGGRVSIAVGLSAVLIAITLGTAVGAMAGYFSKLDNPLMRLTDVFLSLPVLPVLLVLVYLFRETLRTLFGPELGVFLMIVAVIAILNWMPVARLVRASFLSVKQKEFVEAARCVGVRDRGIIVRHIMPNVLSPVLIAATIGVGGAILTESTLSFLGLGFPPDVPTWGRLLYDSQNFIDIAPHWAIFPGLCIFVIVLSVNYIGDGLRDALDPRRKS